MSRRDPSMPEGDGNNPPLPARGLRRE